MSADLSASADLNRFLAAQAGGVYEGALAELNFGHKVRHWMWFIFPQLRGLGHSDKAHFYGLADLAEATAYLAHPVLGSRLIACTAAMRKHRAVGADFVLGAVDALKLRSCLTLFAAVPGAPPLFAEALTALYPGPDAQTLALLSSPP